MAYKLVKLKRAHFKPSRHRFEGAAAMGLGRFGWTGSPSLRGNKQSSWWEAMCNIREQPKCDIGAVWDAMSNIPEKQSFLGRQ
ncbi:hypothetical protein WJX82_007366 [Trebouxia sp. C0006]